MSLLNSPSAVPNVLTIHTLDYAHGGIVPGPLGRPLLATVHGGEMVIPASAKRVMLDMFEGFKAGPDALPQAPPGAAQIYRSSMVDNRTINVGPITINTQATDSREIAQELRQEIQDHIRNIAYDQDGPVVR